jgi:uncharacterized Zn finger protein
MPGFTEADLREAAGGRSFERGRDYLRQVAGLEVTAAEITAMVSGTEDYVVRLVPGGAGLRWSCSCPFGQEGFCCKHCVAVGLAALRAGTGGAAGTGGLSVDAWLDSLSRPELLAELRGLLDAEPALRRRLELRAAAATGDVLSIRRAARQLVTPLRPAAGTAEDLAARRASRPDDLGRGRLAVARAADQARRGDETPAEDEDDAPDGWRARFEADRTLACYQRLRQAATRAGTWPAEREHARALLATDAAAARARPPGALDWTGPVLVDALLDDGDVGAAWTAAGDYPAATAPGQWLRLADAVAVGRPADALGVYLTAIEPLRPATGDKVYEQMTRLLRSARACHEALGLTAQFDQYLRLFRADQSRKPNLLKMLDRNGLR